MFFRFAAFLLFQLFFFPITVDYAYSQAPFKVPIQKRQKWEFNRSGVTFSNLFSGARLNDCVETVPGSFTLTITPENQPINKSPWYGFQVWGKKEQLITICIHLPYGASVSRPKISTDGKTWTSLPLDKWTPGNAEKSQSPVAVLTIGEKPLWVAAHYPVTLQDLDDWLKEKSKLPFVRERVIGKSQEGREIKELALGISDSSNFIFLIGRQHPPEITGSIGLMSFVDTLCGNSELAGKFRQNFQTIVIPVVNPDGVEHGHWRSTLGGVDPNRDYGPFTQMETRNVRDSLTTWAKKNKARVFLFVDFHSTREDIFYTQRDTDMTFPPMFTSKWLKGIQEKFPENKLTRDASHNVNLPTSKTWAYITFGCPGITYELGYSTPFAKVKTITAGAAEVMMRLLLEEAGVK